MTTQPAKFEDIVDGIEFVSSGQVLEHAAYFSRKTGAVFWESENLDEPLPDDIENGDIYIALPHKNDLDLGKRLVIKFSEEFLPESLGKVLEIFSRAGAYPRFKELLERKGKIKQWYDYEEKAIRAAVREWCELKGISVDG